MCGRVVAARPVDDLVAHFGVDDVVAPPLPARYNVAPTSALYAIVDTRRGRRLGTMSWGLIPSWSADPSSGPRPINARAETLLERPLFAEAAARRRLLCPVDGFYEWRKLPAGGRQPHYITSADGAPLALAALWDRWDGPGGPILSCAVVTTAANAAVAPLHDRMPALLPPEAWDPWLDTTGTDVREVLAVLRPSPTEGLRICPADPRVNDTANDGPELVRDTAGHDTALSSPFPGLA